MATFTSSVQMDFTGLYALTSGTTQMMLPFPQTLLFNNPLGNYSFSAVGTTVVASPPPMPSTGTVTEIYGYAGPAMFVVGEPPGTSVKLTGISQDAAVVTAFLTATSQLDSMNFLYTVFSGDDSITGSALDDTLFGGTGADTLVGGLGFDTVTYFGSLSSVRVSLGNGIGIGGEAQGDSLTGFEAIVGSSYGDVLAGDGTDNALGGGDGNDLLTGGGGADTLDGGDGIDTVAFSGTSAGLTVSLETGSGSGGDAEGDTYANIENVTGSQFGDNLTGGSGANRLAGMDGDDFLYGHDGADTLIGGDGVDTLSGDEGDDVLQGGAGDDVLNGGNGNDRLQGGADVDQMTGGDGNDSYEVDDVGDSVIELSGGGTDRVTSSVFFYTLPDQVEVLILGTGAAMGTGNADANTIKGNASGNSLSGLGGVDTLQGLGGDDVLNGGAGNDRLYGGDGNDTFVFDDLTGGVDRIADWTEGDHISIDAVGFGIDVSGGLTVVSGTSASLLTTDGVFYNTASGRLYAFDADTDTLTAFALITAKPASLDSGDIGYLV